MEGYSITGNLFDKDKNVLIFSNLLSIAAPIIAKALIQRRNKLIRREIIQK